MRNIRSNSDKIRIESIAPDRAVFRPAKYYDILMIEKIRMKFGVRDLPFLIEDIIDSDNYHIQVIEQDKKIMAYYIFKKDNNGEYKIIEKFCIPCKGKGKIILPFCRNLDPNLAIYRDFNIKEGKLCDICENISC